MKERKVEAVEFDCGHTWGMDGRDIIATTVRAERIHTKCPRCEFVEVARRVASLYREGLNEKQDIAISDRHAGSA